MKQTIAFIEPYTEFKTVTDNNAFAIREDRPHLWLQKVCCWVLGKLGAYRRDTQTKIEYRTIDADKFITLIAKQHAAVFELTNRRPKELLIGAQDYAELMHETMSHHMFSFDATYMRGEHGARTVMGVKVRVIPWMRGVLKAVRDGIADALQVDDRDPRVTWRYDQQRGAEYGVMVEMEAAQ